MIDKESLIVSLHDLGAVQFGEYSISPRELSPIYIDLNLLVSRPGTLRRVTRILRSYADKLTYDRIVAIPMGGLPIGVGLSLETDKPLIYPRPAETRNGTQRYVEGAYHAGETVIVVNDLISRGQTTLKSLGLLQKLRLKIEDVLVVVDRGLGGIDNLAEQGYTVKPIITLQEITDTLLRLNRLPLDRHKFITAWLTEQQAVNKNGIHA
jgi:orotate phosphoribosyltransferase